ncbi:hypothetical protein SPRG_04829 [Saprolegnia parasitica CBS 223.65]|uniref:Serine/threonine-protein phosphatase PGAM5, mitochondrial n=1 Tax=Saprolegnia parasitica (strain CBS 223.65) TaxID=695850 RepID=A0A067CWL4_SAPPC|nr:hypothetical protein SPRG_04829 [Saprolegnia parasitica CBS 223.65]KDO30926.1 hypothetical protein SPRG_04829 [Saprolegnia parasitica CBS 223.65]|eukprot:XP_012198617.1 hypothetical protein SPRG_04829 [Saprolegnia parasitica CBS 223.65]
MSLRLPQSPPSICAVPLVGKRRPSESPRPSVDLERSAVRIDRQRSGSSPPKPARVTSPGKHAPETTGMLLVKDTTTEWTKRWCQLVGSTLSIYDTPSSSAPWHQLDMSYRTVVRVAPTSPTSSAAHYTFSLAQGGSSAAIVLCRADSAADLTMWVDALSPYAQKVQQTAKKQRFEAPFSQTEFVTHKVASVPPKMLHLILIRHGHYVHAHTKHARDSEKVLSHIGRQQAELVGQQLQAMSAPSRDDLLILHSDMRRAMETATIIGDFFPDCALSCTPLLREGWPGNPSPTDANANVLSPKEQAIEDDRLDAAYRALISTDVLDEAASLEGPHGCRVVVCHANLIRYFLCRALGISPVGVWGQFEINHCSITRLDIGSNGTCKVLSVNECGHLPTSLRTSSEDHL